MSVRSIALVCAVIAAVGCAPAAPVSRSAPLVGSSARSVDDALGVAAQSLAIQGFRVERHAERGEVVGWKVAELNQVGPDVFCNTPADTKGWVVLSLTVSAAPRGNASMLSIDGRARIELPTSAPPIGAGHSCVSSGSAEDRVATALGFARSST